MAMYIGYERWQDVQRQLQCMLLFDTLIGAIALAAVTLAGSAASLTCVAVMTNLPAMLAFVVIIFCASATFSLGTSMARSPRATMMPSAQQQLFCYKMGRMRLWRCCLLSIQNALQ
jgi:hypothetical protein